MKAKHIAMLFLFMYTGSQAQDWVKLLQDPRVNFYDVQKSFQKYERKKMREEKFKEHFESKEKKKGEENEAEEEAYMLYKRWEWFMAPRVYPSGDRTLGSRAFEEFQRYLESNPLARGMQQGQIQSSTWTALGPLGDPYNQNVGRVNIIRWVNNGSNMYLGTPAGGMWKSTDNATSWAIQNPSLSITGCADIAIDPSNVNNQYIATGDADGGDTYSIGVYKSTDAGATWSATGLTYAVSSSTKIYRLLLNPSNPTILLASTSSGIYRSTNSGGTWTLATSGAFKDMEFKPGDPQTVYACGTTFKRSTDGGASWTSVTSGVPTGSGRMAMAVTANDPTYIYIISCNSSGALQGVYRSVNSGTSFSTQCTSPNVLGYETNGSDNQGQGWYDLSIAVSPSDKNELVVGGVHIWKSTNGGTSFTCKTHWYGGNSLPYVHADIHDLQYSSGTTIWAATDGGVFVSTNGGTSWAAKNGQMNISQFYDIGCSASNANLIIGGLQDNSSVLKNGTTWSRTLATGDGFVSFIDKNNNNIMYTSSYNTNLSRSTDGGNNWSGCDNGLSAGPWKTDWQLDPNSSSTIYVGTTQLYKSTNSGGSYTALGSVAGSGDIVEFDVAPSNSQVIYLAKSSKLYKTTNGGSSWTDISAGLPVSSASITCVRVHPSDANKVWVSFSGYSNNNKVFKTTNGGSAWTNVSSGLPNIPANTIAVTPGTTTDAIYVGMDVGVYYSDNTFTTWQPYFTGFPNTVVSDLEIYTPTGKLRAGTYGRGVWEVDLYSSGNMAPTADFTVNQNNICPATTVQFSDLSTANPSSWSWTFTGGNPATSTSQNPSVSYANPGTYAVSLTVTNAAGSNTKTSTAYITVASGQNPPIAESFSGTFLPANWEEKDGGNDGKKWTLKTGVGSQGSTQCSFYDNYNVDGMGQWDEIKTPKLNLAGATSSSLTFDIAYQIYDATYSDTLEVLVSTDCGQTFQSVYRKGGSTLATVTGGLTSGVFTPSGAAQWRTETINMTPYIGNASVQVAFRNIGRYGQALYLDNINIQTVTAAVPVSNFNVASSACVNTSISLSDQSTNAPTSWSWSMPGATPATSTQQNPTIQYAAAGSYTISLTSSNNAGQGNTSQKIITIHPAPNVTVNSTPNPACSGDTIILTASGANTYVWTINGQNNSNNPIGIITNNAGTGTISVNGTSSQNCSASTTYTFSVQATPATPVITSSNDQLTASGSGNFQWYFNGQIINGATQNTYTPTQNGDYMVQVSNAQGCDAFSAAFNVNTIGLQETASEETFSLFPNPNNGNFTLNCHVESKSVCTITLCDALGKTVYREIRSNLEPNFSKTFNAESWPSGLYFLQIKGDQVSYCKKVLIQKN